MIIFHACHEQVWQQKTRSGLRMLKRPESPSLFLLGRCVSLDDNTVRDDEENVG